MLEFLSAGFLYTVLKDCFKKIFTFFAKQSPQEILERREKWKPLFDDRIHICFSEKLREDVIIRDISRLNDYPETDDRPGISPWFRAGLIGQYHNGILIGLSWHGLKQTADGKSWRFTDYTKQEEPEIQAALVGKIPYANIASVEWRGDEYYSYPHIFCSFRSRGKQPYDEVVLCEKKISSFGKPFYVDLISYENAKKNSKKLGVKHL